jgi:hypothetical protein
MADAISPQALSDLIGSIYDCALDPSRWDRTLADVSKALDCFALLLALNDLRHERLLIHKRVGVLGKPSLRGRHEHADAPYAVALLCPRRERPRHRASEPCNELAPFHSITSSARASRFGGMVRPSALAVLRLRTISMRLDNCTGRSAGFSPLSMRPA